MGNIHLKIDKLTQISTILIIITVLLGCSHTRIPIQSSNPVVRLDTADPGIVYWKETLYTYSTSGCEQKGSLHIRQKAQGGEWIHSGFILIKEKMPDWIGGCDFWAPEVHRIGNQWVAYFSARDQNQRFCIGAATADHPAGPFTPLPQPIVSDPDVGLIDPTFFKDPTSGKSFLLWKEDRNDLRPKEATPIILAAVSDDGLQIAGEEVPLITNDQPWEGDLVEAPQLLYHKGWYYLFFSANSYFNENYGVGVARSRNVIGPYEKDPDNPILKSNDQFEGTGHSFVVKDHDKFIMFYHAREISSSSSERFLMASEVDYTKSNWWTLAHTLGPK